MMKMTEIKFKTKVSAKGQVVIPKELREKYGYDMGDELTLTPLDENRILLEKTPRLSELFGFLGNAEASRILLKNREEETSAEVERKTELKRT